MEFDTGADGHGVVVATPPSWRPDLVQAADLVEEVLRLEGYDTIPSVLPPAPPGRGLTATQLRRRAVSRALAETGNVEVLPFPFVGPAVLDAFGLPADDVRRRPFPWSTRWTPTGPRCARRCCRACSTPWCATVARGHRPVLHTVEQVVLPHRNPVAMPDPDVADRPTDAEYAQLKAALPAQPLHVGVVLAGDREQRGWWGAGPAGPAGPTRSRSPGSSAPRRASSCASRRPSLPPWHPGRCAALRVGDWIVGHAGELHPKVVEALDLPPRTCAVEIDLDALPLRDDRPAPPVSPFPPVSVDVALVVAADVPAAELTEALEVGGGDLLEQVRLFDVYTGEQVAEGNRSLAFTLRFRAPDRTLTSEEANAARDAAVAVAADRFGATLR